MLFVFQFYPDCNFGNLSVLDLQFAGVNELTVICFVSLVFVEQDKGLEALSGIIQRQKLMGQAISEEVDVHNGSYNILINVLSYGAMGEMRICTTFLYLFIF